MKNQILKLLFGYTVEFFASNWNYFISVFKKVQLK